MVFGSAGAASAWAGLPGLRRRYLVAEGGDVAGALDCSTWRCRLLIMATPVIAKPGQQRHRRGRRDPLGQGPLLGE